MNPRWFCLLSLRLALCLPAVAMSSEFFSVWPGHPQAPELPGPPRTVVAREWRVELNMRGIVANNAAVQRISVRLPDGERSFTMRLFSDIEGFELVGEDDFQIRPGARDEEISYSWSGVAGGEQMTIAVYRGVMSATITGPRGVFSLIRRDGRPVFQQIDVSRISTKEPPRSSKPQHPDKTRLIRSLSMPAVPKQSVDRVDILVVHTPAALVLAGSVADLNARVAESFLQMEEALRNSGMAGVRVRNVLAGANLSAQVNYSEVPGHSCAVGTSTDLCRWVGHRIWLRTSAAVAALRNTHGADLVVMLVADGADGLGPTGVAYVQEPGCGTFLGYENSPGCDVGVAYASFGFSVVSTTYTTSFQVFAHELAHQFGMQHQSEIASPTPAYPWSHARTNSHGSVQTLAGGYSLARTLQFSNPNVVFVGSTEASGSGTQFNARTGAFLAHAMSNFRPPGLPAALFSDGFEIRLIPVVGC